MRIILGFIISALQFQLVFGEIDTQSLVRADSLFLHGPANQKTLIFKQDGKRVSYFAATAMTLSAPIDSVQNAILNYGDYVYRHKYVERAEKVDGSTRFIVLRVMHIRAWFLGEIVSGQIEKNIRTISFQQSDREDWREWCRSQMAERGRLDFSVFQMQYKLMETDKGTRVSLTAQAIPESTIPDWLFRRVTKRVFPRFLKEIGKKVATGHL